MEQMGKSAVKEADESKMGNIKMCLKLSKNLKGYDLEAFAADLLQSIVRRPVL